MYKISFISGGETKTVEAAAGEGLLDAAQRGGVFIDAPCGGTGNCGKCRVKLVSGPLESPKTRHISDAEYALGWRLACVSRVAGDARLEIPAENSAYKDSLQSDFTANKRDFSHFKTLRDELAAEGIGFMPVFRRVTAELAPPSLADTMPDNERLTRYLRDKYKAASVVLPFYVLKRLPELLRENDFKISCLVENIRGRLTVYEIYPPDSGAFPCGAAVDIGTTSVSAVLIDMENLHVLGAASAANRQIRYGADVIHRIVESVKPGGTEALRRAVVDETINPLLEELCREAGVPMTAVCRMSVAGNTTMEHLFAGIWADPIRLEPYVPAFFEITRIPAVQVGVGINNNARILVAPNVGSYVGGDITAGVLATKLWADAQTTLFIDLGTNGELVLGNADYMMTCACSAGPAFEGGEIICGMRAAHGAIEDVRIDEKTLEPVLGVVGEGKPLGVCGSGLIDAVAELYRTGAINSRGQFIRSGGRIKRDEEGRGRYVLVPKAESGTGRDIFLTEVDIDNFVRAKAAIFSALRTMLSALSLDVDAIDRVMVAGGIGSGINMENAVRIGMLPNIPLEKYSYIGNSSLLGAAMALTSREAYDKILDLSRNMTYLELSTTPGYMDEFVAACFIPHTDESLF